MILATEIVWKEFIYFLSYIVIGFFPLVIALLISKYRSFLTSLSFLPAYFGTLAFIENKTSFLINEIVNGKSYFIIGVFSCQYDCIYIFTNSHLDFWKAFLALFNIKSGGFYNFICSEWWFFIPYLVIFILLFIFVHKKKEKVIEK